VHPTPPRRVERFGGFVRTRTRRGEDSVRHGYFHGNSDARWRALRDCLDRRVRINQESELARLTETVARIRLLRGPAVLRTAGAALASILR
jgi:predicted deacetylase